MELGLLDLAEQAICAIGMDESLKKSSFHALAMAYEKKGEYAKAIEILVREIRPVEPVDSVLSWDLGYGYATQEHFDAKFAKEVADVDAQIAGLRKKLEAKKDTQETV